MKLGRSSCSQAHAMQSRNLHLPAPCTLLPAPQLGLLEKRLVVHAGSVGL